MMSFYFSFIRASYFSLKIIILLTLQMNCFLFLAEFFMIYTGIPYSLVYFNSRFPTNIPTLSFGRLAVADFHLATRESMLAGIEWLLRCLWELDGAWQETPAVYSLHFYCSTNYYSVVFWVAVLDNMHYMEQACAYVHYITMH